MPTITLTDGKDNGETLEAYDGETVNVEYDRELSAEEQTEATTRSSSMVNGQCSIALLPALPEAWRDGKVSGLCARGGYEVSFEWKGGYVRDCSIKARKSGTVTLLYNGQQKTLKLKAGQTMPVKTW